MNWWHIVSWKHFRSYFILQDFRCQDVEMAPHLNVFGHLKCLPYSSSATAMADAVSINTIFLKSGPNKSQGLWRGPWIACIPSNLGLHNRVYGITNNCAYRQNNNFSVSQCSSRGSSELISYKYHRIEMRFYMETFIWNSNCFADHCAMGAWERRQLQTARHSCQVPSIYPLPGK